MQSEQSARRLIDLGADPARVTGDRQPEVRFLEMPAPASHGKPRDRVPPLLSGCRRAAS